MGGAVRTYQDTAGNSILRGANNVLVNNMPIALRGAPVAGHGRHRHARPWMVRGSTTVYANGQSVCRSGDNASCGHPATGSTTVLIN